MLLYQNPFIITYNIIVFTPCKGDNTRRRPPCSVGKNNALISLNAITILNTELLANKNVKISVKEKNNKTQ